MKAAEDFGPWLARQLQNAKKSQTDLADELGLTRAAVSAWIVGRSVPRDETIRRIAALLNTDLETIHTRSTDAQLGLPVSWYHRPAHADGGREYGNAAAFAFEADVSVLAREATQNSLDARLDTGEPVRVRYTLHELRGEALARFREAIDWERLLPHYQALTADGGQQGKVSRTIAAGLRDMYQHDRLVLLRVDDYNATGLTGDDYDNGLFAAVVRRQLDSQKRDAGAGGSYGLGKATLWATSRLGLVLINSTLSEPHEGRTERRLIGRLDLPWREVEGRQLAGPAWFGRPDPATESAEVVRSWWADEETVEKLHLTRESAAPGTSFLIVGAHDVASLVPVNDTVDEEEAGEDEYSVHRMHARLVDALGCNFWAAMTGGGDHKPHLEASVRTLRNGEVLIPEEHVDPAVAQPSRTRALRTFLEGKTVDRLTARGQVARTTVPLNVPLHGGQSRGGMPHEAVLLVTHAEDGDDRTNRLISMRGNRMTVKDSAVTNVPIGTNPFQAILLTGRAAGRAAPGAEAAEEFLRASEPPEHDKWGQTEELSLSYSPSAYRRIAALTTAANTAVRDLVAVPRAKSRSGGEAKIASRLKVGGGTRKTRPIAAAALPELDNVDALIDETGAWSVTVDVRVPSGVDTDRPVTPVAKFDVRSGPRPAAPWKDLVAVSGCEVVDGALQLTPGTRKAVFRGVTDVSRHPVRAQLTGLVVELRTGKGEQA
ncbi:transcriptional regulator with XRE-family HTH domain [Kitasatospora sp. GP30]|uniref:helix-turn-helix domain-containing protein n=1 Tax=Kitasatospora sp. GP30 TaxID=3035084 RepID=UPI000C70E262|nr:helix-turn-helix transcriptional regulator [Kitasatospora sp. GP30]MDH6140462.1 transcriptional regulator with XRE-family HTH domain [Kitasatospora sp. GP30]